MDIKVLSKSSSIEYTTKNIPPTCIISITNPGKEDLYFNNPNIVDVLHVKFADSLYRGRMSEADANAIINFVLKYKDCEHFCGTLQSRAIQKCSSRCCDL